MNEAIANFNALVEGEKSIKVDAQIPDSELLKVGVVIFIAFATAFVLTALVQKL